MELSLSDFFSKRHRDKDKGILLPTSLRGFNYKSPLGSDRFTNLNSFRSCGSLHIIKDPLLPLSQDTRHSVRRFRFKSFVKNLLVRVIFNKVLIIIFNKVSVPHTFKWCVMYVYVLKDLESSE